MAELKVKVVEIESVNDHPNADRLDIIKVKDMDYVIISGKGNLKAGDLAFYFPVDSVLPEKWVNEFDIAGFYFGRIKATKLRGIFSEGLLIPVIDKYWPFSSKPKAGQDVNGVFNVTKYDPPIPVEMQGQVLRPLSASERFPSPEHFKTYSNLLVEGEEVVITEKYHGANFGVAKFRDGTIGSHSHNDWMIDSEENKRNLYVRIVKEYPELAAIPALVHVYGEIIGVQDLKYGLDKGKINYVLFGAKINDRFLNYTEFQDLCNKYELNRANVLFRGPYTKDKVTQYNNVDSTYPGANHMMEGVVINPVNERYSSEVGGRLVLKFISEKYHLRKNGTENK